MRTKTKAVGLALVGAIAVSVGCSSSKSDSGESAGSGGTAAGAGGKTSSSGGTAGKSTGGHAGTAPHGGASGAAASGAGGTSEGGTSEGGTAPTGAGGSPDVTAGAAGVTGSDPCAACPSGLCLPGGECVACLPDHDVCPTGQYCDGSTNTCAAGCKGDTSCASGVCTAGHDCQNCVSDQECSAGNVCSNSQCSPPCTEAQEGGNAGCGAGLTCCSLHCVDATSDSAHCGTCGTSCGAGALCGTSACTPVAVSSVCKIAKIAIVTDDADSDNDAARALGTALVASCTPAPTQREITQTSTDVSSVANPTTGEPVSGGDELLVVAGGFFFARVMNYTETSSVAPLYAHSDAGTDEYIERSSGATVASFSGTEDPSQYYFVVQFFRDPTSGSLVLNVQGFWQAATTIGAKYFADELLPTLAAQTKSWYVYKWNDTNSDTIAQATEITLVDSGP